MESFDPLSWDAFITACLSFPTVVYTAITGVGVLYWLLVILGAVDVDVGGAEIDFDIDSNTASGSGGYLEALGIGIIPLPMVVSVIAFFGWAVGLAAEILAWPWLQPILPDWLFAVILIPVQFLLAVRLASWCVNPLRRIFVVHTEHGQVHLIGKHCAITSGRVDPEQGTAEVAASGPPIALNVRTRAADTVCHRHQNAVIVDYDEERGIYFVEPVKTSSALPPTAPQQQG